jgi:hypothetical protein
MQPLERYGAEIKGGVLAGYLSGIQDPNHCPLGWIR